MHMRDEWPTDSLPPEWDGMESSLSLPLVEREK